MVGSQVCQLWPNRRVVTDHLMVNMKLIKKGEVFNFFFSSANREGSYLCMIRLGKKFCIDTMTSSTHTSIALRKKRTSNMKPSYCKSFLTDSI